MSGLRPWTDEDRAKGKISRTKNSLERIHTAPWDQLRSKNHRKCRVLWEQGMKCILCGMDPFWNGKILIFHYDHIDGKNKTNYDNRRENVRMICPNCHSQTDTYCSRNATIDGRKRMAESANRNFRGVS